MSRCPIVPIIDNPHGLDKVIVKLQTALQSETWLTHIYGLVRFGRVKKNDKTQNVPMIYVGSKDYNILNLNDTAVSISYFQLKDDQRAVAQQGNFTLFEYDLSLVVLCNLELIDNTGTLEYHYELSVLVEKLKDLLLRSENITLKSTTTQEIENVFNRWSKDAIPETWWLYPYTAFRINFSVVLPFDCTVNAINFQQQNC